MGPGLSEGPQDGSGSGRQKPFPQEVDDLLFSLSGGGNLAIRQVLRSYGLEQKLLAQHITQEKLISMRQADIDKLRSLTNEDRQHLGAILENYLSKHNLHEVNYSESMSELLKHNELSSVIGKMTRKRIAQKRLLSLSPATINELSSGEGGEGEVAEGDKQVPDEQGLSGADLRDKAAAGGGHHGVMIFPSYT